MIILDNSNADSDHPETEFHGSIKYGPGLTEQRLEGIKDAALFAWASGARVQTWSHVDNCSQATELGVVLG